MIFAKSAFSMEVRKTLDFGVLFGVQKHANSRNNRLQKCIVINIESQVPFFLMLVQFWRPKIDEKSEKIEKLRFERLL